MKPIHSPSRRNTKGYYAPCPSCPTLPLITVYLKEIDTDLRVSLKEYEMWVIMIFNSGVTKNEQKGSSSEQIESDELMNSILIVVLKSLLLRLLPEQQ